MLEAKFVRENPDAVRTAMRNRGAAWDVDGFLGLDEERRKLIGEVEALQARRNEASKAIGALMKDGKRDEADSAKDEVRGINDGSPSSRRRAGRGRRRGPRAADDRAEPPGRVGARGRDEDDNVETARWGTPREFDFEPKAHWDLGPELGIIDFERGVKLAKSRFVLLGGMGAQLERALINFMLDTHDDRAATRSGGRRRSPTPRRSPAPASCPSSRTTCSRRARAST